MYRLPLLLLFSLICTVAFSQMDRWIITSDVWLVETDFERFEQENNVDIIAWRSISKRKPMYAVQFKNNIDLHNKRHSKKNVNYYLDRKVSKRNNVPNDPDVAFQWAIEKLGLYQVWNETTGGFDTDGKEIVVAVLDDAFDLQHPDFEGRVWENTGEIPDNNIDDDGNGYTDDFFGLNMPSGTDNHPFLDRHGTAVAGIIGAAGNNEYGITGVNWNVKLMFLSGIGLISTIVEGYEYAYEQRKLYNETNGAEGAYVVATNLSAGLTGFGPSDYPEWCDMYDALGDVGVLSAGAVPNEDVDLEVTKDLPSDCPSPFTIMATNTNSADFKVTQAGYGATIVDLGAPGEEIYTLAPGEDFRYFSGTSASCPYVAGAIALLFSVDCPNLAEASITNPSATALAMKDIILENVDVTNDLKTRTLSGGRLNIFKAMQGLANSNEQGSFCDEAATELIVSGDRRIQIYFNEEDYLYSYFTNKSEIHTVILFDALGKIISSYQDNPSIFNSNQIRQTLFPDNLMAGMYFIGVQNNTEKQTLKLLVQN